MNTKQVVEKLKSEAASNPVANAVFHVFALRSRTRSSVVLTNLISTMEEAGFNHPKEDYAKLLRFLAGIGIGTLKTTPRGLVKGLYDIKLTLQSIGLVACDKVSDDMKGFRPRGKFGKLPVESKDPITLDSTPETIQQVMAKDLRLTVNINGKTIQIPVPKDFTKEDIVAIVNMLNVS